MGSTRVPSHGGQQQDDGMYRNTEPEGLQVCETREAYGEEPFPRNMYIRSGDGPGEPWLLWARKKKEQSTTDMRIAKDDLLASLYHYPTGYI